jgi:NPCBM/NEW2 domain
MRRGRTLFWTIAGSGIAAGAVAIALIHATSGTPRKTPSSSMPPGTTAASSGANVSTPVVTPPASSTSSVRYLSDLHPSGDFAGLVTPDPVNISGSIYPKSVSFYCNVGDATAFPEYRLQHGARRFEATIGLAAGSPAGFQAGVILVGDGRTLRTITVSVPKPKTVDVDVRGVHTLRLECFGGGNSATGGEAVDLAWGNARVVGRG